MKLDAWLDSSFAAHPRATCGARASAALALRADLPIYATPRVLDHAEPAPLAGTTDGGGVREWLERVKPEDFSPNVDDDRGP